MTKLPVRARLLWATMWVAVIVVVVAQAMIL
jgi:hypothetical protein